MSENAVMTLARGSDAGGALLDLVAAVDYLSATQRLGLTVWEAVEEAVRWWASDRLAGPDGLVDEAFSELPWDDDPDPLRTGFERLLACTGGAGGPDGLEFGVILTSAIEGWVRRMADLYNAGHRFAHPAPRHGWPSPRYDTR
ncbi:MAG: hypothetical protein QM733_04445 [Ilumatobacteraceae bacterium]